AQKDYKEKARQRKTKTSEIAVQIQESQTKASAELRKADLEILTLESQYTAALRKKAKNMIELNSETSKYTCTQQYKKAAEEYAKAFSSSSSNSAHIKNAKNQKAAALNAFNKCMEQYQNARAELQETSAAELKALT
ncbi:MAG: hypothetical protein AAGB31_13450, partial [Bdellovibrio sp.]